MKLTYFTFFIILILINIENVLEVYVLEFNYL